MSGASSKRVLRAEFEPSLLSAAPATPPAFLIAAGLLAAIYIPVGGQLYLGELLVIVSLPFFLGNRRAQGAASTNLFVLLSVFLAVGWVLATAYNGASASEALPDVVASIVLGLSVFVLVRVLRSPRDLAMLLGGYAVGSILALFVQPTSFFADSPWKFGFALPVTMLVLIFFVRGGAPAISLIAILSLVGFSVLGDYRSLALLLAVAALLVSLARLNLLPPKGGIPGAVLRVAVVGGTGLVVAAVYAGVAASGLAGESAKVRLALQGGGNPLSMLLGGRYEPFFSIPAALQNPLFGYGPSPTPPAGLLEQSAASLASQGLYLIAERVGERESIPTHSFIMGGWVGAGIFGLVFWLVALILLLRAIPFAERGAHAVLRVFVLLLGAWNLLFSPFGGSSRFLFAVTMAWAIVEWSNARPRRGEHRRRIA